MTFLRPAAFIAAVMVGLFGLVAAPMAVQAEVTVVTPIIDGDGTGIGSLLPCPSTKPTCTGWCITGTCTKYGNLVYQYVLINGVWLQRQVFVVTSCACA